MTPPSILFATDFSHRDTAAFKTACDLALKSKSKLLILYVQDPRVLAMHESKRHDPNVEFERYIPHDYEVSFDHVLKTGGPSEHILGLADEKNASIIVLGTHGREGLDRVFQGSVAEQVMRGSAVPVMTVRDSATKPVEHLRPQILVPIDFSVCGYAALDFATKMALSIGGDLTIAHVNESGNVASETWEQLKEFVPNSKKVNFAHKLLRGSPGNEVCDYADAHHSDFIVLGSHGRSGIGRVLMGSVAESVVRHANCPVITVKPSNKKTGTLSA